MQPRDPDHAGDWAAQKRCGKAQIAPQPNQADNSIKNNWLLFVDQGLSWLIVEQARQE
jgi:hypothetical protein